MTSELNNPEPVSKLMNLGWPVDPWPDYPAEFGFTSEHIPDLIRMATDACVWEEDSEDTTVYRNVHAWRALGQMRAAEAIPGLLEILSWADDPDDDWLITELPQVFGMIGPKALPALVSYFADKQHGYFARITALDALEEIGKRYPETQDEIIGVIMPELEQYEINDYEYNAWLILTLEEFKRPDTYPLVKQAFQADRVDTFINGDWQDFQVRVGLLPARITPRGSGGGMPPLNFGDFSGEGGGSGRSQEDKKTKNKRKQEKSSRKQNRPKKKKKK